MNGHLILVGVWFNFDLSVSKGKKEEEGRRWFYDGNGRSETTSDMINRQLLRFCLCRIVVEIEEEGVWTRTASRITHLKVTFFFLFFLF